MNIKAKVQVGIYKKNTLIYNPISRLIFRPGLFHKLINPSNKKELYVLELETPYKKKTSLDLKINMEENQSLMRVNLSCKR